MKRSLIAAAALAALTSARAFAGALQYIPCTVEMGCLQDPGSAATAPVEEVVCRAAQYNSARNRGCHWVDYLGRINTQENQVVSLLTAAASAFGAYPTQAAYLRAMADDMSTNLIGSLLSSLQSDVQRINQCFAAANHSSDGCYHFLCGDESKVADRIYVLSSWIQRPASQIQISSLQLLQGLPVTAVTVGGQFKSCLVSTPPVPCRQAMQKVINGVVAGQAAAQALISGPSARCYP